MLLTEKRRGGGVDPFWLARPIRCSHRFLTRNNKKFCRHMSSVGERRERPTERVYGTEPGASLLCGVCGDVYNVPVSLPCGHTFCRSPCATRSLQRRAPLSHANTTGLPECPLCRAPVTVSADKLSVAWALKEVVEALVVHCRYGLKEVRGVWGPDEAGCPALLPLNDAAAHEATCGFAFITCPFAGCGVVLRPSAVAAHDAACMAAHLQGEHAAREASEARVVALEAVATAADAAKAHIASLEVRLDFFHRPPGAAVALPRVPPMHSFGWEVCRSMQPYSEGEIGGSACAISPDGRTMLACGGAVIKMFDILSGALRTTLACHTGATVNCCSFSPDGRFVLSGSTNALKLWCATTGTLIRALATAWVGCCAWSPDARSVLCDFSDTDGSCDESLHIVDVVTGVCTHTLKGHMRPVCCSFSPDGVNVLSGMRDGKIALWSVANRTCTYTLNGHDNEVTACCFSPDGRFFLSSSSDKTLKLWVLASGACHRTFTGHTGGVLDCAFSPAGDLVLSCSRDKTLKLWDVATSTCTATLEGHEETVLRCAISCDGQTIISNTEIEGCMLKVWRRT